MKRAASARWEGGLKDGKGTVSASSRAFSNLGYTFGTRFGDTPGTNPEELIAAAHAGCFSMALSGQLGERGLKPRSIDTTSTVTIEKVEAGFTITEIHLEVSASVPGASPAAFDEAAAAAKAGCPVSRALNARITMTARLAG